MLSDESIKLKTYMYVRTKQINKLIKKIQISSWTYLFKNIFILSLDLQQKFIYIHIYKLAEHSQGWLEGSLFNSYYTEV